MLLPIGIAIADIDNTWLATTDSFGRDRGLTAHKAASKVTLLPDPVGERSTVAHVVSGLGVIDQRLSPLRR